jgi:DNA (cytosine-5)-methyltransferase 3A
MINNSKQLVVCSLFDGMSCFQLALNKLGIKPTKYFASEIDKYAIGVTMANFPNTIQIGDVRNIKGSDLGFVDIIAGGSPCQNFSFSGKRKGMSTKNNIEIITLEHYLDLKSQNFEFEGQSYLFWEYMRVLKELREINPKIKFLLENVVMGEKWQKILTKAIGIHPIKINSALVSAQNRNRLYWTNIGCQPSGFFGDLVCAIPQPKDKGILLKDILENDVDDKYYLSHKMLSYLQKRAFERLGIGKIAPADNYISDTNRKARCFTAGGNSGGLHTQMDLVVHNTMPRSSKTGKGGTGHLSRNDGKTYCLDTGNTNAIETQCFAMRGRNTDNPKSRVSGLPTEQQLEPRNDGKTNCLTSVQKDNLVISGTLRTHNDGKGFREVVSGKGAAIPARAREDGSGQNVVYSQGDIRRLTPIECERLQTVPDNYTNHLSDTQRYKMLGNGWTIDVIAHILSFYDK